MPGEDQPLFQISKPNPNAPYWSLFYFACALVSSLSLSAPS